MSTKKRVLIIDDEPEFVEAFRMTLGARRYEVLTASSKPQAQEAMNAEPDIVVLGTLAPAGQAFAVREWLRQHPRHKDVPILVVDARYEDRYAKGWRRFEGLQLDVEDYVTKPVEPATLVPRIHALLQEALRRIRVLVADDHTMVRHGICALLALQKDMEVVGEAIDGREALEKVLQFMPDVALMDILMPTMSGLEATKLITRDHPQTKVLMLTQYDEEENMLVAKRAGAHGFVPKRAASSDLVSGIKAVNGGKYYPQSFADLGAS
ncbi:MAG: response regulator [Chloroflexota bacterium]|nr:response regulator [Chloroflexota bacterium]